MITNDNMFISVKHMVLEHVARLAWNDELDEDHLDALVDELIPGPKPQYRCCIYKERGGEENMHMAYYPRSEISLRTTISV